MSFDRAKGNRCSVRQQMCISDSGVRRATYQVVVQCGKGRMKAEILRAKIEQFIRAQKAHVAR